MTWRPYAGRQNAYTRTNYRVTGKWKGEIQASQMDSGVITGSNLPINAIGDNFARGSQWGGAGTSALTYGMVIGSFASTFEASNRVRFSAYGVLSQCFGSTMFTSGYRIIPIWAWNMSIDVTATAVGQTSQYFQFWATQSAAPGQVQPSIFYIFGTLWSIAINVSTPVCCWGSPTHIAGCTGHFAFLGFVVSTP